MYPSKTINTYAVVFRCYIYAPNELGITYITIIDQIVQMVIPLFERRGRYNPSFTSFKALF